MGFLNSRGENYWTNESSLIRYGFSQCLLRISNENISKNKEMLEV